MKASNQHDLIFLPLGGAGEIGMNMNLYGLDGSWIMVDCGIAFADSYFPGINVVLPDISFIEEHVGSLGAIILTHAHEDHLGAVPFLWSRLKAPIYATEFCARVLKKKLTDLGMQDQVTIHVIEFGDSVEVGPFNIEFLETSHSIPQAQSLMIRTHVGNVFHTGDWKLDLHSILGKSLDTQQYAKIGKEGVMAMVCDSTNVFLEGKTGSEEVIYDNMFRVVQDAKQYVFVTLFASNIARLKTIFNVAEASGRSVCLVGKALIRMHTISKELGYFEGMNPVSLEQAHDIPQTQVIFVCTGCQGETRGAMRRILQGGVRSVALTQGDTVIFSSSIIPGNELAIRYMQNKMIALGCHVVGPDESGLHVSGHPSREDLTEMYALIRPSLVIPVHGEMRHIQEHCRLVENTTDSSALCVVNGDMISLSSEKSHKVTTIETGQWMVDNSFVVDSNDTAVRERRRISENGLIIISIVVNAENYVLTDPKVSTFGLTHQGGGDVLIKKIESAVLTLVQDVRNLGKNNTQSLEGKIRQNIRRILKRLYGLNTLIDVQFILVN